MAFQYTTPLGGFPTTAFSSHPSGWNSKITTTNTFMMHTASEAGGCWWESWLPKHAIQTFITRRTMQTHYCNPICHSFCQCYLRFTYVTGIGNAHHPVWFNWLVSNIGETDQISVEKCCCHWCWFLLLPRGGSWLDLACFGSCQVFCLFGIYPVIYCWYNVFWKYFRNWLLFRSLVRFQERYP